MFLTYGNIVRTLYLALFAAASILSFLNYHTNAVVIAGLSLLGFIAFDIICYFRKKIEPIKAIESTPEVQELRAKQDALEAKFNTVASDIGLAKISAAMRR